MSEAGDLSEDDDENGGYDESRYIYAVLNAYQPPDPQRQ